MNNEFNAGFKIPEYITTDNNHIVGTDGSNKMSKSLDNAIYIRDSHDDVVRKVNEMKWRDEDDGLNVVMEYIRIFAPVSQYETLNSAYLNKELDELEAKRILIDILDNVLQPMRERMKPYLENKKLVFDLLYKGTKKVKKIVDKTTIELRNSIGLVNLEELQKKIGIVK